jgi:DNA-binding MarR family transcriptional regulator
VVSKIDFAHAYRVIRSFERDYLRASTVTKLDVLMELYRCYPSPIMTKVLSLSANVAEKTVRSALNSLLTEDMIEVVPIDDLRTKYYRLTKATLKLMEEYERLVTSMHSSSDVFQVENTTSTTLNGAHPYGTGKYSSSFMNSSD